MTTTGATREYPKDPPQTQHTPAQAQHAPAQTQQARNQQARPAGSRPERTVPISTIHDEEIEKVKGEIATLVQRAREVELSREDPLAERPEIDFINELQDIFRQVHKLNARWLADPGYEYVPPPAPVVTPGVEPAPPPGSSSTPGGAAPAPAARV